MPKTRKVEQPGYITAIRERDQADWAALRHPNQQPQSAAVVDRHNLVEYLDELIELMEGSGG